MGTDKISPTLLVGVGHLGQALAAYGGFGSKGYELVALFDQSPQKVGQKVGALEVQAMDSMEAVVEKKTIRFGMMAVPASAGQAVADRLIRAGVRGLLNFAPGVLEVPSHVVVHSIDVALELEQLSFLASDSDEMFKR